VRAAEWVKGNASRYAGKCEALGQVTTRLTLREILAFVLFTPQLRYERSVLAWRHYMSTGIVLPDNMWKTRKGWLDHMPDDGDINAMIVNMTLKESAKVLADKVPGLGPTKAPFFLSLLFPCHPRVPVCTDVHMLRAVGMRVRADGKIQAPVTTLREAQARLQRRARRAKIPSFAYQWALWDYTRSGGEPVKETSLERDLAVR